MVFHPNYVKESDHPMKLNSYILLKELEEKYDTHLIYTTEKSECNLSKAALWNPQIQCAPNSIYIVKKSDLPSDPDTLINLLRQSSFAIVSSHPHTSLFETISGLNLILIHTSSSFEDVFNFITNCFNHFQNWERALQTLLIEDKDLEQFYECSKEILNNPIVIFDRNFCILYHSPDTAGLITWEKDKWSGIKMLPLTMINELKINEQYRKASVSSTGFILDNDQMDYRAVFSRIHHGYKNNGMLMVFEKNKPLTEGDRYLAAFLSKYLQKALKRKNNFSVTGHNQVFEQFLTRMLYNVQITQPEIEKYLSMMGWSYDDDYICIKLQINDWDRKSYFLPNICSQIENIMEDSFALPFEENIVAIVNLSRTNMTVSQAADRLKYFLREGIFRAGISWKYWNFSTTQIYYHQAEGALEMGIKYDPNCWCYLFREYSLQYFIQYGTSIIPAKHLCDPNVVQLYQYDAAHGTNFLFTLKVYLECGMNAILTAENLFIHRNTLHYRIRKIQQIIHINLENPEERMYIMISYKMIELLKKLNIEP